MFAVGVDGGGGGCLKFFSLANHFSFFLPLSG